MPSRSFASCTMGRIFACWAISILLFNLYSLNTAAADRLHPSAGAAAGPAGELSLFHRRNRKVGAYGRVFRPALGHGLEPCVEAHALVPIDMVITEQRTAPATEAVEGHRHWNGHVDSDHADFDLARKGARDRTTLREYRRAVREFVGIDQPERGGVVRHTHHRKHRTEDFLAIDLHVCPDVIKEKGADEETTLALRHFEAPPIEAQRRALLQAGFHVAEHAGPRLGRHQGSHVRARGLRSAYLQRRDALVQARDQTIRRALAHRDYD